VLLFNVTFFGAAAFCAIAGAAARAAITAANANAFLNDRLRMFGFGLTQ
jgi:hypothetical protein